MQTYPVIQIIDKADNEIAKRKKDTPIRSC